MDHDHTELSVREAPSQANFIGWLALALLAFAIVIAAFGLIAGSSHGWQ
jgi:hypothetical protein